MFTVAAASLAPIPICREGFWAPMVFTMMGGIIVRILLKPLFLPALYVAWFRVAHQRNQAKAGCAHGRSTADLPWYE
jgi:hypothetical protein